MRDFMRFYSNLVDRCFNDCINDFTSKTLTSKEVRYIFYTWNFQTNLKKIHFFPSLFFTF